MEGKSMINQIKSSKSSTVTPFENLLIKDKYFTIHHHNFKSLAIKIYKPINNLPGGSLSEFYVRNNHNYNVRSRSDVTAKCQYYFLLTSDW